LIGIGIDPSVCFVYHEFMDSFDVVAVGNAKVDIFLQVHDTNKHFRLDPESGELCIRSGDKASIDSASIVIGGNAASVTVGISRMGFKSAIFAEIGSDEFADKIINTLNSEKVSEKFIKKTQSASSFSVIINYKNDRTIFTEHVQRDHDFSFENLSTKWVYLTSMGNKWHDAYRKTVDYVKNNNIKLAFNPGSMQLSEGAESFREVLEIAEILFINKEEAKGIASLDIQFPDDRQGYLDNMQKLLTAVKNTGPKTVVITDGERGSHLIDEDGKFMSEPIKETVVVQKTGAGDAFASGFLSAILSGQNNNNAMKWGKENAASVIGQTGATKGLLNRNQIESLLKN